MKKWNHLNVASLFTVIGLCLLSTNHLQAQVDSSFVPKCSGSCKHSENNSTYLPYNQFVYALHTNADLGEFNGVKEEADHKLFVRLNILPDCYFKQTRVLYQYLVNDSVFLTEETGVIDTEKEVWLQTPRALIKEVRFSFLYEINFKKDRWKGGQLQRTNRHPYDSTRKWVIGREFYQISGDTVISFNTELVTCQKIEITSEYYGKTSQSYMLFHKTYGFMVVDAHFVNGTFYRLNLVGYDSNYCINER